MRINYRGEKLQLIKKTLFRLENKINYKEKTREPEVRNPCFLFGRY